MSYHRYDDEDAMSIRTAPVPGRDEVLKGIKLLRRRGFDPSVYKQDLARQARIEVEEVEAMIAEVDHG